MICFAALVVLGCASAPGTFLLVDHRDGARPREFHESFTEAYFDRTPAGNIQVALRRQEPGGMDSPAITQIAFVRTFWRSVPGRTTAESTQINANVGYFIVSGETGESFEGSGAVFFNLDNWSGVLTGTLDHATLALSRQLSKNTPLFSRVTLSGKFRAERNPQMVARWVNEMNRRFGPDDSQNLNSPATPPKAIRDAGRQSGAKSPP
ncbi:MAG: hypothetical protein AABZ47_03580 [Planctomycetota bacterium]